MAAGTAASTLSRMRKRTPAPIAALGLLAVSCPSGGASAQDETETTQGPPEVATAPPPEQKPGFFRQFFDEEDGKLDFSNFLARGGFIPIPIIISEPAVDGGFGIAAAFLSADPNDPRNV